MGLVILPIYVGALIIYIFCVKQIIKWYEQDALQGSIILFGLLISLSILIGIGLSYYNKERVYGLSPMFRIPFWLIYIPGIIGFILIQIQNIRIENIGKTILMSILFSGVLMLVFNKYTFGILDFLKIEKYY